MSATTFSARFRSLDDPSETYPLTDVVYRDRKGGLLEVAHDTAAWSTRTAAAWRTLFSSRPDSGVWAQREWVQQAEDNVIDRLYQAGLIDAPSDFDQTLELLANNILAYNKIPIDRPLKVRTLLTEPLETLNHKLGSFLHTQILGSNRRLAQ